MLRPAFALVVLYNVRCEQSSTCRGLQEMGSRIPVLIYDNSTCDMGNRAACEALGWTYLGGDGNMGLSVAYNTAIALLQEQKKQGFLCLFDDDTQVDKAYFDALSSASEQSDCRIFVPVIHSHGTILSPMRLFPSQRTARFASVEALRAYTGTDLSAINSGMALDLALFDNYRYDERIFLDGIDHLFLRDMKRRGERIGILPYECEHTFSGDEKPTKEAALARFRIFRADYRYILREHRMVYYCLTGKRALHLCLQYRTTAFLKTIRSGKKKEEVL